MRILVPNSILEDIKQRARNPRVRCESGGLLLGFRKADAIQVTRLTYPSRWDKATPLLFMRSALGHRMTALRAWKASGGTVDWVGEWHTHPFASSNPSSVDLRSWRKLAKHSRRPMAFMIAGGSDLFAGVQSPNGVSPTRLTSLERDESYELFG
ncbi:Mov34/MPN/PAD-1 family protein [Sphingopyxis sp.]|uniref:Mov34/MPN/PAD-1 family protein n=1 Tax=Sphingopyxis sp. TaxID=1908224 RepID=UPI00345BFA31